MKPCDYTGGCDAQTDDDLMFCDKHEPKVTVEEVMEMLRGAADSIGLTLREEEKDD